jgi:hypothetical protein
VADDHQPHVRPARRPAAAYWSGHFRGPDADGTPTLALFGEVYDASVTQIEVDFDDGRTLSLAPISGAYQLVVTHDAEALTLRALDAEGGLVYGGDAPPLPGGGVQPGPPPEELLALEEDSQ